MASKTIADHGRDVDAKLAQGPGPAGSAPRRRLPTAVRAAIVTALVLSAATVQVLFWNGRGGVWKWTTWNPGIEAASADNLPGIKYLITL